MAVITSLHRPLTLACLCVALGGCAAGGTPRPVVDDASRQVYRQGNEAMRGGEYGTAIRAYQTLPQGASSAALNSQVDAETAYSLYKQGDYGAALEIAEAFIERYPTHPRRDYMHYLRAVASLQLALAIDESEPARRAETLSKSYDYFQTLSQGFTDSEFNERALRSLVFVRQQLAQAHLEQAKAELRRGDTPAALTQARYVETEFHGTPAAHAATALVTAPAAVQQPAPEAPAPVASLTAGAGSSATTAAPSTRGDHIPILDPQWIMQQNPERYTVELVPAASDETVRAFVDTHNIHGSARYPSATDKDRNTLIHGLYPDADSARMAANQLIKRWGLRGAPVRRFAELQSTLNSNAQ